MFQRSLDIVAECGIAFLHVFPYSPRPGTPAARMPQLDPVLVRERAARLRAIKGDIDAHLADGDLSPGTVAKRQQVSDSYIRKLFSREGTSFSEYVLARRLALAHRMLSDRRWAGAGIASIAYDAGFGDLSYFNRAFKRRYEMTPSELRQAAKAADSIGNLS